MFPSSHFQEREFDWASSSVSFVFEQSSLYQMTSQVIGPDGMTPLSQVTTPGLISCVDGMEVGVRDGVTG